MDNTRTTLENLESDIAKLVREYAEDVTKDVKKLATQAAESAVDELHVTSPHDSGDYAKAWTKVSSVDTSDRVSILVFNKGHGQITHLLEKGHAKVNGGTVRAKPHIAKAATKAAEAFENSIKEVV